MATAAAPQAARYRQADVHPRGQELPRGVHPRRLYQQALEAKGYTVTLKTNLGSTEIAWKALKSGQIQGYPEYDGTLLATIAGHHQERRQRRGGGD